MALDPSSLTFDRFELDLRSGELRKDGQNVPLQTKPFQLLALLVEHSGEVVKREEVRPSTDGRGYYASPRTRRAGRGTRAAADCARGACLPQHLRTSPVPSSTPCMLTPWSKLG